MRTLGACYYELHSPTLTGLLPIHAVRAVSEVSEIPYADGYSHMGFHVRLDPFRRPLLAAGFRRGADAEDERQRLLRALQEPDPDQRYNPFEDLTLRPALWSALELAERQAKRSLSLRIVAAEGGRFRIVGEEPSAGVYAVVNPDGQMLVVAGSF